MTTADEAQLLMMTKRWNLTNDVLLDGKFSAVGVCVNNEIPDIVPDKGLF